MANRITNFLHDSVQSPGTPPVLGTAFDVADVHTHDMTTGLPTFKQNGLFEGIVESIHIRLTAAATPTQVTIRLCLDAAGDYVVVPDTTATLVAGITTATTKCAAFEVGIPLFQLFDATKTNLYLFAKVDAGTANMAQSCITWRE